MTVSIDAHPRYLSHLRLLSDIWRQQRSGTLEASFPGRATGWKIKISQGGVVDLHQLQQLNAVLKRGELRFSPHMEVFAGDRGALGQLIFSRACLAVTEVPLPEERSALSARCPDSELWTLLGEPGCTQAFDLARCTTAQLRALVFMGAVGLGTIELPTPGNALIDDIFDGIDDIGDLLGGLIDEDEAEPDADADFSDIEQLVSTQRYSDARARAEELLGESLEQPQVHRWLASAWLADGSIPLQTRVERAMQWWGFADNFSTVSDDDPQVKQLADVVRQLSQLPQYYSLGRPHRTWLRARRG